jgi:uncharacterized membrane protein YoaK (UPF0700 family)
VLAYVLAAVAGSADAVGYITLFHLFTAHMTGNTVGMVANAGAGPWHEALRRAFPIPVFVAGVVAGGMLTRFAAAHMRARFYVPLAIEAVALALFGAVGPHVPLGPDAAHATVGYFALATLPALAMGVQAATLRRIGDHSVRTTFVTGMLTLLGEQLVAWRMESKRARRSSAAARARFAAIIWVAYAIGGLAAAVAAAKVGFAAVVIPIAGIGAALALEIRTEPERAACDRGATTPDRPITSKASRSRG